MPKRQNILYLVHRVPFPPDKGDRIRNFNLLRFLAQRCDVHLACLADEPVSDRTRTTLAEICACTAIVPVQRGRRWVAAAWSFARGATVTEGVFASLPLCNLVSGWARRVKFDAVVVSASSMVPYLQTPELRDVPAIIDLVDVDSQKWSDYAESSRGVKRWLYRTESRRLRRLERGLPGWSRAVTLVSEAEADILRRFCVPGTVRAVSNGVDLDYFRPSNDVAQPETCVFVGALDYHPNIEGACWFCHEVWPSIRARRPAARIALVGRRPAPAILRLAEIPGVDVVGQVPDVRPHVACATITVVPLRIARGVQNKVLEAMAMARPVVTSPQGLDGIAASDGVHLLTAATPAQWVETVTGLFNDAGRRVSLGAAAREFVEQHHEWNRCLTGFANLLGIADDRAEGTATCDGRRVIPTESPVMEVCV